MRAPATQRTTSRSTTRAALSGPLARPAKRRAGRADAANTPASFRVHGLDRSPTLRDHVRERLGLKVGKFATNISRVSVRLDDLSGPVGKPTISCTIKVMLNGLEPVVVEAREPDPWAAVDVAIEQVQRAVSRALSRRRTQERKAQRGASKPVSRQRRA